MVLSQLVGIYSFVLLVVNLPAEDFAAGVDDYCVTFDFSSDPLGQAQHEIFIHEEADAIRYVIPGLSLVAAISVIDDWEELVLDHPHCLFDYY